MYLVRILPKKPPGGATAPDDGQPGPVRGVPWLVSFSEPIVKAYGLDEVKMLRVDATGMDDAVWQTELLGCKVLSTTRAMSWSLPVRRQLVFPQALFGHELIALLEAALSLVETDDILARKRRKGRAKKVLDAIALSLREGQPSRF